VIVLVAAFVVVLFFLLAATGDERCGGDALSGFLPCDDYPDCECDDR
jgi:hypothetical protein